MATKLSCAVWIPTEIVYEIETEDFYRGIAKDVKKRLDTRGYSKDENRPLPIGKNKKSDRPDER